MREVSIRQFQQNFHKELKDLPFLVTKYKKPIFKILKASELDLIDFSAPASQKQKVKRDKNGYCPHGLVFCSQCL